MHWYVYHLPPIDNGWFFAKTVDQMAAELAAIDTKEKVEGVDPRNVFSPSVDDFIRDWQSAQSAAAGKGWEGDFRTKDQRVVIAIPDEGDFHWGFVFKQDNNGSTFVVSPVELPHLARYQD